MVKGYHADAILTSKNQPVMILDSTPSSDNKENEGYRKPHLRDRTNMNKNNAAGPGEKIEGMVTTKAQSNAYRKYSTVSAPQKFNIFPFLYD